MICLQAQAQVRLSSAAPWGWGGVSHRFHCSPQVYPAGQASNRALEAGVQSVAFETGVQSVAFRDWCAISTTPHPPAIPPPLPLPCPPGALTPGGGDSVGGLSKAFRHPGAPSSRTLSLHNLLDQVGG